MNKNLLSCVCTLTLCATTFSSAETSNLSIINHSFESEATNGVGTLPTGWIAVGPKGMLNLNAAAYKYADNAHGLDGSQVAFYTETEDIVGNGISQVLTDQKAIDHSTYTMTIGIGERQFHERFAGVTLELRLADDTLIGTAEFGFGDITFNSESTFSVTDVVAQFSVADVDNSQDLKVVILAGGGAEGGPDGRQSLDIDNLRLTCSHGGSQATPVVNKPTRTVTKPPHAALISVGNISIGLQP